jgi:hypothetical protein
MVKQGSQRMRMIRDAAAALDEVLHHQRVPSLRSTSPREGPLGSSEPALGVAMGFVGWVALVGVCKPDSRYP